MRVAYQSNVPKECNFDVPANADEMVADLVGKKDKDEASGDNEPNQPPPAATAIEKGICSICKSVASSVLFMKCRHMPACEECYETSLRYQLEKFDAEMAEIDVRPEFQVECPYCRTLSRCFAPDPKDNEIFRGIFSI